MGEVIAEFEEGTLISYVALYLCRIARSAKLEIIFHTYNQQGQYY